MKACPNCKSRATKIVHLSAPDKAIECQVCGHRYDEHPRTEVRMAKNLVTEFYGLVDEQGNLFDVGAGKGRVTLFTNLEDIERERKVFQRTMPRIKIVPFKIVEESR